MKIAVGADGKGRELKDHLCRHLERKGCKVVDFSPGSDAEDYPDVALAVALAVSEGRFERAVLVCGTGLGMAIVANKVVGVRAASVSDPYSAERARKSNDAQVLCLGSLVVGAAVGELLVDHWLASEFQGGSSAPKVERINEIDATLRADGGVPAADA